MRPPCRAPARRRPCSLNASPIAAPTDDGDGEPAQAGTPHDGAGGDGHPADCTGRPTAITGPDRTDCDAVVDDDGSPASGCSAPASGARPRRPAVAELRPGAATGVGSLPHRSAREAVRFAMAEYDVPAIPSLPRRCPAEGMIAQAVVGINGVTAGQYGSIAVDPAAVDPYAPVITDIATDSFAGLRRFLEHAVDIGLEGPVKWQFVGPVTLGVALARAGLPDDVAFAVAARAVRSHVVSLAVAVAAALPRSPQIVIIDEPWFGELFTAGFPIAPTRRSTCCRERWRACQEWRPWGSTAAVDADVASLLAAGPDILSIPARPAVAGAAGYLARFLEEGGRIAWGVVATDGPMFVSPDRQWRELMDLWEELGQRGIDADLLRQRSLVTAHCGLGLHTPVVAERVCRAVREIGRRIAVSCDDQYP